MKMLSFAVSVSARLPLVRGFVCHTGEVLWKTADLGKVAGYRNPIVFAREKTGRTIMDYATCGCSTDLKFRRTPVTTCLETLEIVNSMVAEKSGGKNKKKNLRAIRAKRLLKKTFERLLLERVTAVKEMLHDDGDPTFDVLEISEADGSVPFLTWVSEKAEFLDRQILCRVPRVMTLNVEGITPTEFPEYENPEAIKLYIGAYAYHYVFQLELMDPGRLRARR